MTKKTAHLHLQNYRLPQQCCCHNEQFWVYWRNRKEVGEHAPIFRRPAWLETIIVNHKPEDLTHKPLRPFKPCVNNCRSCPVDVDLRRHIEQLKKGGSKCYTHHCFYQPTEHY